MACSLRFRICGTGNKTVSIHNVRNICVGNAIWFWDYKTSNNSLGQSSHISVVFYPWQCPNITHLDKSVEKPELVYLSTQCLTHSMSSLPFFVTFVLSLSEHFPSIFSQSPKIYQTPLGHLLAVYADLWDELQIQMVVAFPIEHLTSLPFSEHLSKEM